ncbi:MAG: hypothetical protein K2P27_07970 [Lachnospiraceae bacterium]|nr:hypothetical protein [Lachnospiraceae bacterium]
MKTKSRWTALAAAFVLLALTARTDVAYGAVGIETEKKCSITFDLSVTYEKKPDTDLPADSTFPEDPGLTETVSADRYEELKNASIEVELFRIASVDISGKYQAISTFEPLQSRLGSINSQTSAQEWEETALAAREIAMPAEGTPLTPDNRFVFTQADRTLSGLQTGLYLVTAQDVVTSEYIYHFTPYLVSLPGNAYGQEEGNDDAWLYDVTVGLKPSQEDRYGDLEIQKTLRSFNATLGGASFVFQVEAQKGGESVYSNVVSAVFDNAGTKTIRIEKKIPAGALVTVTEIHSGASYEVVSDPVQTQTIIADETVSVSFVNDYDERLNGGTSVVNHFYREDDGSDGPDDGTGSEGVWNWTQQVDSTRQAGGQVNEQQSE